MSKAKAKPAKNGWITFAEFREQYNQGKVGPEFQQSGCQTTGEVYVRPITGRFKDKSEEELRKMVDKLVAIFVKAGHPPVLDKSAPLWTQAEFLDNMLEFETNPPCGCESEFGKEASSG